MDTFKVTIRGLGPNENFAMVDIFNGEIPKQAELMGHVFKLRCAGSTANGPHLEVNALRPLHLVKPYHVYGIFNRKSGICKFIGTSTQPALKKWEKAEHELRILHTGTYLEAKAAEKRELAKHPHVFPYEPVGPTKLRAALLYTVTISDPLPKALKPYDPTRDPANY